MGAAGRQEAVLECETRQTGMMDGRREAAFQKSAETRDRGTATRER